MRKSVCRHFNGIQNEECELKINYRSIVGGDDLGWATRLPCIRNRPGPIAQCDKYEEPSAEEVKAEEDKIQRMFQLLDKAMPLIEKLKSEHKRENWQGIVECPVCLGNLHARIATNGHVRLHCETKNCLWMIE